MASSSRRDQIQSRVLSRLGLPLACLFGCTLLQGSFPFPRRRCSLRPRKRVAHLGDEHASQNKILTHELSRSVLFVSRFPLCCIPFVRLQNRAGACSRSTQSKRLDPIRTLEIPTTLGTSTHHLFRKIRTVALHLLPVAAGTAIVADAATVLAPLLATLSVCASFLLLPSCRSYVTCGHAL